MVPQLIWIIITCLAVGVSIAEHGKAKTGSENCWTSIIAAVVTALLLWWGGFFAPLFP